MKKSLKCCTEVFPVQIAYIDSGAKYESFRYQVASTCSQYKQALTLEQHSLPAGRQKNLIKPGAWSLYFSQFF